MQKIVGKDRELLKSRVGFYTLFLPLCLSAHLQYRTWRREYFLKALRNTMDLSQHSGGSKRGF